MQKVELTGGDAKVVDERAVPIKTPQQMGEEREAPTKNERRVQTAGSIE
jgi:hypothetical protein